MSDNLDKKIRDWSGLDAVQQVWADGYAKNRTAADSAIFEAGQLLSELHREVERLRERVGDPLAETPANAYWKARKSMLDSAVKHYTGEVERLRGALEFYADYETWWAVVPLADPPAGEIIDDLFIHPADSHKRERPGKRAFEALYGKLSEPQP